MAVNPITNKHIVVGKNIDRAKQISTRDSVQRGTSGRNETASITPGKDYTKNYAITLKDVDSAVLSHIKTVLRPKIKENNELVNVPVIYGNEERWVSIRKNGYLREETGDLMLPLIAMRRISHDANTLTGHRYPHDVHNEYASIIRNSKWSKNNRYDRFSVQTGIKPTYENVLTTMPNFRTITYDFVLWTSYMEQMNELVELFFEENNKYWGGAEGYKFLTNSETISDASEIALDNERFIKMNFQLFVKAYLLPEYIGSTVTDKVTTSKREVSFSKVVFGFEGDATNEQVDK
jgi:hypothetical protein